MWVRFESDFDWRVPEYNGHVVIAYKAGEVYNVTRACAEEAKAAGAAKTVSRKIQPEGD